MPWILISLIGGGVVAAGASAVAWRTRRESPPTELKTPTELKSSQWFALGIVFLSVGLSTMPTLGAGMIGLAGVGVIYLLMGIRARDSDRE